MSKYVEDSLALIATIGTGAELQSEIDALKAHLASDEATEADQKAIIDALVQKLAVIPPAPTPAPTPEPTPAP